MEIRIKIKAKPVSVNDAYYRAGQLKVGARQFRMAFLEQLLQYESQIRKFKAETDELIATNKYAYELEIVHLVPEKLFYTADGSISNRAGDVSNLIKLIEDFLTHPKYNREHPDFKKDKYILANGKNPFNLCYDDKLNQIVTTSKIPHSGKDWVISIVVSVIPIIHSY